MPSPTSLPPLVWLRAFCEAGRHGSFKAAAEELHVTPSTVSHEIRKLEDWVQRPLFERRGPSVRLTREGEELYEAVRLSFDGLAIAFQQFASGGNRPLRIGMLPFFASEIVIPHLGEITDQLGGARLQIDSNVDPKTLTHVDPSRRMDAVIRFGVGATPGFRNIEVARLSIAPVLSTSLAATLDTDSLDDLGSGPRVDSGGLGGWQAFSAAHGANLASSSETMMLDNDVSAMRAVEQGLGVGIAVLPLMNHWIEAEHLEILSAYEVALEQRCWVTYARESPHYSVFEDFAAWLSSLLASPT